MLYLDTSKKNEREPWAFVEFVSFGGINDSLRSTIVIQLEKLLGIKEAKVRICIYIYNKI
jgi:hypothetical protein